MAGLIKMDLFKKCNGYTTAKEAMAVGLYPYFIAMDENEGTEAIFKGKRLIMCGSNNYLGLTTHPKVRQAARDAIDRFGTSCTGSRFLNGTLEMHEKLEQELADFVGKQAALVFSTGMQTNLGTISALVDADDVIVLDKEDHASIVDGARLSQGRIKRFFHNDLDSLKDTLADISEEKGKLVVVDGLFSMEGDIAPLPQIVDLCKQYGARLMVDDAHALGVLGEGRGTAAHYKLTHEVDLIMSTFSKSLASLGGFVAGDEVVIHYIKHHARSLIFSASVPPSNAAAALAALQVIKEEPERVRRVNQVADQMRKGFRELGFDIGNSSTPVIPILVGDDMRTIRTWRMLFDNGVFVNPVLSPAVSVGRQMLRTSYMATHTDAQMEKVLDTFKKVGKEVGLI
jgi:8-amino-7-oxononanoate synthase